MGTDSVELKLFTRTSSFCRVELNWSAKPAEIHEWVQQELHIWRAVVTSVFEHISNQSTGRSPVSFCMPRPGYVQWRSLRFIPTRWDGIVWIFKACVIAYVNLLVCNSCTENFLRTMQQDILSVFTTRFTAFAGFWTFPKHVVRLQAGITPAFFSGKLSPLGWGLFQECTTTPEWVFTLTLDARSINWLYSEAAAKVFVGRLWKPVFYAFSGLDLIWLARMFMCLSLVEEPVVKI